MGGHYLGIFWKTWPDEFAYGLEAQVSARTFEEKLVCLRMPDANHYREHDEGALDVNWVSEAALCGGRPVAYR